MPPRPRFGDDPAERLLVDCVRWPRTPAGIDTIREVSQGVDWAHFTALVQRHRVNLLVVDALAAAGLTPDAALRASARQAGRVALATIATATGLIRAFDDAAIDVAIVKGPVLSMRLYGRPDLRDMHDLDLLVAPDDLRTSMRLLARLGYRQTSGASPDAAETVFTAWMREEKDVTFATPDGLGIVELHHRRLPSPHMLDAPTIDDATAVIELGSTRVRTLPDAALFAYLASHGTYHHWFRLKWLSDIQAIAAGAAPDMLGEWHDHACARNARQSSACALALSQRIFGTQLPAALLQAIDGDRKLGALVARCERRIAGTDAVPIGIVALPRFVDALLVHDSPRYRWHHFISRWQDWRLVARLPLPRAFHFCYLPLRLVTWLATKAADTLRSLPPRRRRPRP